jgi:O-antigen ligase
MISSHDNYSASGLASADTRRSLPARMQVEKLTPASYTGVVWAAVLAILVAGLYSNSASVTLLFIIVVLGMLLLLATSDVRFRAVDWAALSIGAFEIPSLLFSKYRAGSVFAALAVTIFVLTYFVVRLTVRTTVQIVVLSGLLGVCGACLAIFGLSQFNEEVKTLAEVGLTNLVAFRSRLFVPPNSWIPGEWFTLLLLALPFAVAVPAYFWRTERKRVATISAVIAVSIVATLTLSLSRAVFWSMVLFFVGFCTFIIVGHLVPALRGAVLLLVMLGGLILVVAVESAFYPTIRGAYTNQHTSQIRSIEGRLAIWHRSLELVRKNPFWGVGSSNSALVLTSSADNEETIGFASRTFSLPLQLLAEKGLIGCILYSSFLVLLGREFIFSLKIVETGTSYSGKWTEHRREKARTVLGEDPVRKAMTCCFAAGLLAIVARELVYSSLMEHTLILAAVAVICALLVRPPQN